MHVLLRGVQSGTSRRCRRGRYNSGIGPSSALRCTQLDAARDERHHSAPS
jgi:hypothetical protein